MAKHPGIEEAVERARRVQEDRINAIRSVAHARQGLVDTRESAARELSELQARIAERIREAEREDLRAYNAATAAGWSPDELKKIGFDEPEKKARARKRSTRRPSTKAPAATPQSASDDHQDAAAEAPVEPREEHTGNEASHS